MKLLNNYLSLLGMLGAAEAVALGEQVGLDMETMVDILNVSTGKNAATEDKFPEQIIPEQYNAGFTLALMHKDLRLFDEFANDHEAPIILGSTVRNLVGYARSDLGDNADMSHIYTFMKDIIDDS